MSEYKSITLSAGEVRNISTKGKVFAVDTATGSFTIRFGSGAPLEGGAKRVFGSSTSGTFKRITVANTSGSNNTIVYAVSMDDIKIESTVASIVASISASGKNSATYTKGTTASLAAGGTVSFTGADGSGVRKSFSVFNNHATDDLNVRGANNTLGHVCPARTGYVVESGGAITLHNPGAAAITYAVMEVFYSA